VTVDSTSPAKAVGQIECYTGAQPVITKRLFKVAFPKGAQIGSATLLRGENCW